MTDMTTSIWRGLSVRHPADWELSRAAGAGEDDRLTFVDRRFERLDVRWRKLTYVPDLPAMLTKYRKKESKDDKVQISDYAGAPKPWRGVVRSVDEGKVLHAGKVAPEHRCLIEAAIIWPQARDLKLEREILESITFTPDADPAQWRAMGIEMTLDREYALVRHSSRVGCVSWEFAAAGKGRRELTVYRVAMPQYWLKTPIEEWLRTQLPPRFKPLQDRSAQQGDHHAAELISSARISTLASLRGKRRLRLDRAWLCPVEQRVYQVTCTQDTGDADVQLPPGLSIRCCTTRT